MKFVFLFSIHYYEINFVGLDEVVLIKNNRGKRERRNHWQVSVEEEIERFGHEIKTLWNWKGNEVFEGPLPWKDDGEDTVDS